MKPQLLPTLSFISLCLVACSAPGGKDGGSAGGAGATGGGTAAGGGAGGGSGGGGGSLVALSSFCAVTAIKTCDHQQTCGALSAAQVAECRAQLEARCTSRARGTDAGSYFYDAVAATACVASSSDSPCYGGPEDLSDCLDAVFQPAGRLGAPCEINECIEGFCPFTTGAADSCRACTAYFAQGNSCTQHNSCNPAVGFCAVSTNDGGVAICEPLRGPGGDCVTGFECAGRASCVRYLPIDGGKPHCGPIALGTNCGSAGDCAAGAYCQGLRISSDDKTTLGTCATRLPLNSPCTNEQWDDGCQGPGATCLNRKCVTAQPHTRPLSGECDAYDQCPVGAYCSCAGPLTDDGGVSVRDGNCLSQQGLNGSCWIEEDYSMCLPGLECLAKGICTTPRSEGENCGVDAGTCLGYLNCTQELTPGAPTCVAARQPGQSCAAFTLPCATDSFCRIDAGAIIGVCARSFANGAACDDSFECRSSRCLDADAGKACGASCR